MGLWSRALGGGRGHLVLCGVKCGMGVEGDPLGGDKTGGTSSGVIFGRSMGFCNWANIIANKSHCAAVCTSSDMMSLGWWESWAKDGVTLEGCRVL